MRIVLDESPNGCNRYFERERENLLRQRLYHRSNPEASAHIDFAIWTNLKHWVSFRRKANYIIHHWMFRELSWWAISGRHLVWRSLPSVIARFGPETWPHTGPSPGLADGEMPAGVSVRRRGEGFTVYDCASWDARRKLLVAIGRKAAIANVSE